MADKNALLDVIEAERMLHPRMDGRDLQKLVHQSVFGGDHLLVDPTRYAHGLEAEWGGLRLEDWPVDEPLQSIDPEGRTARIHLAACKRMGIDLGRLIDVLVNQERKDGRAPEYARRWLETIALARQRRIPFSVGDLTSIGTAKGIPHHGSEYGQASYRIVNDVTDRRMDEGLRQLGVRG